MRRGRRGKRARKPKKAEQRTQKFAEPVRKPTLLWSQNLALNLRMSFATQTRLVTTRGLNQEFTSFVALAPLMQFM